MGRNKKRAPLPECPESEASSNKTSVADPLGYRQLHGIVVQDLNREKIR